MEKVTRTTYASVVTGLLLFTIAPAIAQTGTPESQASLRNNYTAEKTVKPNDATKIDELDLLKATVSGQQRELDALKKEVQEQRIMIAALLQSKAEAPKAAMISSAAPEVFHVNPPGTLASTSDSPISDPVAQKQKAIGLQQQTASPLSFAIGDAYFTPFGFFDLTAVLRDKNLGSGLTTNFGAVPSNNTVNGNLGEYQLSAQNSRFGLRIDTKVKGIDVLGYLETDFQGLAPGSVAVATNSVSPRLRLGFVDLRKNKFEILAGQAFGMLTPNRRGLSPLPVNVFLTQGLDPSVHVGLPWTRSPQFRFIYHATRSITLGWSIESAEQYGGGALGSGVITFPSALASAYGPQLNTGNSNFSVPNPNQDHVGKIAFDSNVGKREFHIEVAGLFRRFAFYNPLTDTKFNAIGGGVSVNGNIAIFKNFRFVANTFYSHGGGRHMFGQGPDLIIRGDGSPQLIKAYSTNDGFEYQATPRTMIYAYYGGDYFERAATIDPANGEEIGFGYNGSPSNHNRAIQQGTFGVNYTLWRDPNYGAMQFMTQYSYLMRHSWFVGPAQPGSAHLNMLFLTFRYVLPGAPPAK